MQVAERRVAPGHRQCAGLLERRLGRRGPAARWRRGRRAPRPADAVAGEHAAERPRRRRPSPIPKQGPPPLPRSAAATPPAAPRTAPALLRDRPWSCVACASRSSPTVAPPTVSVCRGWNGDRPEPMTRISQRFPIWAVALSRASRVGPAWAATVSTLDERQRRRADLGRPRGGDVDAYGELFARHVEAARRLGRQLVPGPDVDDLVSEAFAKVLGVLQRGGGPDLAFRAYLLTAVRRLHVDRIRATAAAAHDRRPDAVRPRRAVPRHRRRGLRERGRSARLRLAPRALAAGAVAHRGRGPEAGRGRPAARHDRRTPSPRSPTAPARGCARRTCRCTPATSPTTPASAPAPTSAPTSAAGSRAATRPGSSSTSRSCRRCTAIYLELTEVNSDLRGAARPAAARRRRGGVPRRVHRRRPPRPRGARRAARPGPRRRASRTAPTAAVAGAAAADGRRRGWSITLHQDHDPAATRSPATPRPISADAVRTADPARTPRARRAPRTPAPAAGSARQHRPRPTAADDPRRPSAERAAHPAADRRPRPDHDPDADRADRPTRPTADPTVAARRRRPTPPSRRRRPRRDPSPLGRPSAPTRRSADPDGVERRRRPRHRRSAARRRLVTIAARRRTDGQLPLPPVRVRHEP